MARVEGRALADEPAQHRCVPFPRRPGEQRATTPERVTAS
jgi:hypothetical protein